MKTKSLLVTLLLALSSVLAVSTVRAEDAPKETKVSKKNLAKYDADKDGKLNDQEKAALQADKDKAKAERKAKKEAKDAAAEPAAK
jgi:hypothetical protein